MQNKITGLHFLDTEKFSLINTNLLRFLLIFACTVVFHEKFDSGILISVDRGQVSDAQLIQDRAHTTNFFSSEIPFHSSRSSDGVDAEIEPTEDDIRNDLSESFGNSFHNFNIEEIIYTSFIKSRYLRLASSIQQQSELPYFVLYHSWKTYLV